MYVLILTTFNGVFFIVMNIICSQNNALRVLSDKQNQIPVASKHVVQMFEKIPQCQAGTGEFCSIAGK
jgi:hypothetical protein